MKKNLIQINGLKDPNNLASGTKLALKYNQKEYSSKLNQDNQNSFEQYLLKRLLKEGFALNSNLQKLTVYHL